MAFLTKLLQALGMLMLTMIDLKAFGATGTSAGIPGNLSKSREIYLGLYGGGALNTLRRIIKPVDSLQCYKFTKGNSKTEQCKFYGDCCVDPMRIRDRLEPGTFSCQTTPGYTGELIYVIDKCPSLTGDKNLVASCEQLKVKSNMSITTWPVTAKRTGLSYKNIFCAICHGVLAESEASAVAVNYSISVDFWWLSVNCDKETVSELTREYESFSMEKLDPLLTKSECGLRFSPPSQPHRCVDAVRSCPEDFTDVELKLLCEQGPVSYSRGPDNIVYRNYFCQLCHGLLIGNALDFEPAAHTGLDGSSTSSNYPNDSHNSTFYNLTITDQSKTESGLPIESAEFKWLHPLIKIKPKLQLEHQMDLSRADYLTDSGSNHEITDRMALTNFISDSYIYSFKPLKPPTSSYWDFGSQLCDSLYQGICDKLISRPGSGCRGPGCGVNSWQDTDNVCYELSNYKYNISSKEQAEFMWPHALYGRYSSSCNPDTGLQADWWGVNCRCDPRCHYFNECCMDTPLPANYTPPRQPLNYSCVSPSCQSHIAIISTCPTGSDIDHVRLCNQGEIGDWSPVGWTVSDSRTNLSYKNIYCALCNGVTQDRVTFWRASFNCTQKKTFQMNITNMDDFYHREWQGDCNFVRFIPNNADQMYTCYNPPIVSSCPQHLATWRVSDDCENKPTSWVVNNKTLYRNAYCAICNLGDKIMEADIDPHGVYNALDGRSAESLYNDLLNRSRDSVIVDVSENKCCYGSDCTQNTHSFTEQSPWGKIWFGNSSECLKSLPFDTKCDDQTFNSLGTESSPITFLCSGVITPLQEHKSQGCVAINVREPPVNFHTPSFSNLIFTDFGEIPLTQTVIRDTQWIEVKGSLLLCSNGTNQIQTSGASYSKLRLSPSTLEVKLQIVQKTLKQPSLEVYDYILLSLSLISLSVYIIYMFTKKKRHLNTPELMKISALISLFGALLCYSVAIIPAGKDIVGCRALAAILHFFLLSTFTWTSAMGINITHIIFTMQPSSLPTKRYLSFACYAVGVPLTLVLTTFILSMHQEAIPDFESPVYREHGFCFLQATYIIYFLFLGPVYAIVFSNVALCIICIVRVSKATGMTTHDKERGKRNIVTCINLTVILGLGWIMLFLLPPYLGGVHIAFQIFLEIQGLLVVVANLTTWKCIRGFQKRFVGGASTTQYGDMSSIDLRIIK